MKNISQEDNYFAEEFGAGMLAEHDELSGEEKIWQGLDSWLEEWEGGVT